MINFVKSAYAAAIPIGGPIEGSGIFGTHLGGGVLPTRVGDIISSIISTMSVIGGLAFVIFFFLGALKWISAGGDKGKVQEAQSQMTNGVIGLVALTAGYFIVGIVGGVLGLDILNPIKILFP